MQAEVTADPKKTSSYKAMLLAEGILLILNEKTSVAFSRVWCQFEEAMMFDLKRELPFLYDLSTTLAHKGARKAHLLADGGPAAQDVEKARHDFGRLRAKADRESAFPIEALRVGLRAKP